MSEGCGPYRQMGILGEQMARSYQVDPNLELGPHLSHYMDEVEVNIAADRFDHVGFMQRIHDRLQTKLTATAEPRAVEFLEAVVSALQGRIDRKQSEGAGLETSQVPLT